MLASQYPMFFNSLKESVHPLHFKQPSESIVRCEFCRILTSLNRDSSNNQCLTTTSWPVGHYDRAAISRVHMNLVVIPGAFLDACKP